MAVLVIGSLNVDVAVPVERLPTPGETVLATGTTRRAPGGKGLNQAIAAARQGATVALHGAVGGDEDGRALLERLHQEGVDVTGIARTDAAATGLALITVDAHGANMIVVAPGANATAAPPPITIAQRGDVVLAQLEVPIATVTATLAAAHERGATTILNASPVVAPLPDELADAVDLLVVNEHEAAITGLGARTTIVTLGERGARLHRDPHHPPERIDTIPVEAVDTTGAGDAFAGTLAACLSLDLGLDLDEALRRASIAGALTTTRPGAADALPTRREVEDRSYKP